jgi:phosphoglycolate phosphatase
MSIKGIIFDLDGTLVNSIEDISDSMNVVLKASDYPIHTYETYETFIGSGIRNLVSKAIPSSVNTEQEIDSAFIAMLDHYKDNCTNKTSAYKGIPKLLKTLYSYGIKMAVLSNKADGLTKKVVTDKLPSIFKPVIGLTSESLKKPNPEVLLSICEKLELDIKKTFYIGDSVIDIQTAKNAGLISVVVTWGFQSKENLLMENPDYVIETPQELLYLLDLLS